MKLSEMKSKKSKCTGRSYTRLEKLTYDDRDKIYKRHLPLFDFLLKTKNTAMELLDKFFSLFEKGEGLVKPGIYYNILEVQTCESLVTHFYNLFHLIDHHLKDCSNLRDQHDSEHIVIDFFDTLAMFLEPTLEKIKKYDLSILELNVNSIHEPEKKVISVFENFEHRFESILLEYIEKMNVIFFEMIYDFNLDLKRAEILKLDEIIRNGKNTLVTNIPRLKQTVDDLDILDNANKEDKDKPHEISDTNVDISEKETTISQNDKHLTENVTQNIDEIKDEHDHENTITDEMDEETAEREFKKVTTELFREISTNKASKESIRQPLSTKYDTLYTTDTTPSLRFNPDTFEVEGQDYEATTSWITISCVTIGVLIFASLIGGLVGCYCSIKRRTKNAKKEEDKTISNENSDLFMIE